MSKTHCPTCEQELEAFEVSGTIEAFCAQDAMEGLNAYGPYPVRKTLIHEMRTDDGRANYVHIRFEDDGEERLVVHHL